MRVAESLGWAVSAVLLEKLGAQTDLLCGDAQRLRISHHVPALLLIQTGESRHEFLHVAHRDDQVPVGKRGLAGEFGRAKRRDGDALTGKLGAHRAVTLTGFAVTGGAFLGIEGRAILQVWRFLRVEWAMGSLRRWRLNGARRRGDVLRQRHIAGGEQEGGK